MPSENQPNLISSERLHRLSGWMIGLGALSFALILLCMLTYARKYLWYSDYLSAMGLARLGDGTTNYFTCIVFNLTLVMSGISSGGYFVLRGICARNRLRRLFQIFFAVIGAGALIGIGCTPYDLFPDQHMMCTYFASGGFGLAMILAATEGKNSFGDRLWNFATLGSMVFVMSIWFGLNWCVKNDFLPGSYILPIMQKIMIGGFWLWMIQNTFYLFLHTRARER